MCPTGFFANYTNTTNRLCSPCDIKCTACTGSPTNCSSCANVISVATGNTTVTQYYKDAILNVCLSICSSQQFMNPTVSNVCSKCDSSCIKCSSTSSTCQSCSSGYYLYSVSSQCLANCPQKFYKNPVMDSNLNSSICSPCSVECFTCYGPLISNCTACTNTTSNLGTISFYFKQPGADLCAIGCPTGYFSNTTNNNCDACQKGCVSSSFNMSYCNSCTSHEGIYYYLDKDTNSCVTVCPNGGSGNNTDFTCIKCQYFAFNGQCL